MSPPWILVVDAPGYDPPALREAVRAAAAALPAARVEEHGGRLVLVVPSEGVHPAAVAIRFPGMLAEHLAAAPEPVRLVIDSGDTPDRALRVAGRLHGPAVDPPLTFALTEEARRALGEVPLRDFRKVTIYGGADVLDAWIRTPDDSGPAAPAETYHPGQRIDGSAAPDFGPPPGPDFPTDR
jgi:hypothetical protein